MSNDFMTVSPQVMATSTFFPALSTGSISHGFAGETVNEKSFIVVSDEWFGRAALLRGRYSD
jgi:hypothetical protein